jgi:branched-chain amino acid transport system permease protein
VAGELPVLGSWVDLAGLLLMAAVLFASIAFYGPYVASLIGVGCAYCVAALGYNISMGLAGQFAFGQAGYLAIGAYTFAIAQTRGVSTWEALLLALVVAGVSGAIVGLVSWRTRGIYLALLTLGFAEATVTVIPLLHWSNGDDGLAVTLFPGNWDAYAIVAVVVTGLCVRLVRSRTGRSMLMIKSSEATAAAMGVNVGLVGVLASALSAAVTGLGGVLLAGALGYITPSNFTVSITLQLLTMVIVGGLGSVWGVVLGTALITALPNIFDIALSYQDFLYAGVLFAVIVAFPRGLASAFVAVQSLVLARRRPEPSQ